MVRASALYMVIVIALVVGIICAALVASAFYYRLQYQKQYRYAQLQNNIESGVNILLYGSMVDSSRRLSLFNKANDTVLLSQYTWGVYDMATVSAFVQRDTLKRAFSIGCPIDSTKWSALYIIDEDRSVSVNGRTSIQGDAFLPKAGIKPAYINGRAYEGNVDIVSGHQFNSERTLPALNSARLTTLQKLIKPEPNAIAVSSLKDSIQQSWFDGTLVLHLNKYMLTLSNLKLSGRIILRSDTSLTIDSTCNLKNVIVIGKSITIGNGFKGNCQLFASDSISIGKRCVFNYPSCAGVLRFEEKPVGQEKLALGDGSVFSGSLFTFQKADNKLKPLIDLGKKVTVNGQIYSQGMTGQHGDTFINGNLTTARFLYQSQYTAYENYMIDLHLDQRGLSRYYLSSSLFPAVKENKKILQWLVKN